MKTIDEILDLANSHADLPSQAIIDSLYDYEDELRAKILELELDNGYTHNLDNYERRTN